MFLRRKEIELRLGEIIAGYQEMIDQNCWPDGKPLLAFQLRFTKAILAGVQNAFDVIRDMPSADVQADSRN
jgi:hypothetical protein